jgi:hypothetical protein
MRTQAQLCHIDTNRCVVLVTAYGETDVLGSALGEGATAEQAEDRALQRLNERFNNVSDAPLRLSKAEPVKRLPANAPEPPAEEAPTPEPVEPAETPKPLAAPATPPAQKATNDAMQAELAMPPASAESSPPSEAPTDPEDWSDELAAVDLELQRVGWERDQERSYLERAFGHGSRHKLTRYSDLIAYLKRLKALEPGTAVEAAPVPLRRADLIIQGDQMLQTLQWSGEQARNFLQQELGATSRQSLSDEQLLTFNMLLENQLVNTPA